ncbi:MAG: D-alanyl-D-alanine carboxypeptidase/D-alanyl-D-alanine endopeptidase [Gammaproteobacteria bacterium]
MRRAFFCFLRLCRAGAAVVIFASASAAPPPDVRALMKQNGISPARAGIVIFRSGEDAPLLSHQPQKLFNPASLTKLPLAFAAFDILGPRHQWKTAFKRAGEIEDGVLRGDLILSGGGDPHLTAERFLHQINDLRSRGLRAFTGDLIIDDTLFLIPPHDTAAFDGAARKPYNAGGGALAVNFNAHKIVLSPRRGGIRAYLEPPNENFVIDNQLRAGRTRCSNWRGRISERYRGDGDRITLSLRGRYSPRCGEQAFYATAISQAANAAGVFGALWRRLGGEWSGKWRVAPSPPDAEEIAVFESPPLYSAVAAMNKFSNNVIARNIFLSLAEAGGAPPYSPESARAVFDEWMRGRGIEGEFFVDNGSGLSREGRMSAGQMATLLRQILAHPLRAEIISSLPILGIDGTLRRRLTKTARGRGHLKTGSLNGVNNIAGFLRDEAGRDIVFICMIESSGSRARRFQDAMIRWTLNQ